MDPETPLVDTPPLLALGKEADPGNLVSSRMLEETLRGGLSVFKGDSWMTDGELDDAGGERIFRLQFAPDSRIEDLLRVDRSIVHSIL